ncbi:MAG: biopolymer transport protein ExbD [Pseudomonadota bacterium]|nr:biopolymer transport protein ExbD [Pseudomonadota bacterium]
MNLRPKRRDDSLLVDITPLIDVVFILLLFFMVASTFDRQAKLKIDLPEASAQAQMQEPQSVVIAIDAKGRYHINDRQLVNSQKETLKLALQKTVGDNKNTPLVLRADARTPHQAVVNAMDVAAQLGLTRLSIATLDKGAP